MVTLLQELTQLEVETLEIAEDHLDKEQVHGNTLENLTSIEGEIETLTVLVLKGITPVNICNSCCTCA